MTSRDRLQHELTSSSAVCGRIGSGVVVVVVVV
jgi:hypothetical protein